MTARSLLKSAILVVVLVGSALIGWEVYLRSKGITPDYDDGAPLWSDKRAMVYEPKEKTTVFIGSSRIKYDLDIPTWQILTDNHAVQLAMEGTSPVPVLENLGNDTSFRGRLVVDVTEPLFFSFSPFFTNEPKDNIHYYKDRSPAQKASFVFNHALESQFVFLDKYNFSPNGLLDKLPLKSRPGVFVMPIFPMEFGRISFDRQDRMTDRFISDTSLQNQVRNIWGFLQKMALEPPVKGDSLLLIFKTIKTATDKIKARGGEVLFVRTPSSGPMRAGEERGFPRKEYWDKLLEYTQCQGIHFSDYPPIDHFVCPEFSHLSPADAIVFTKHFINILQLEKGWSFQIAMDTIK